MKLRITLNDKTFEVDVEVAEADTAALPPAYPIGSAVLSGSVAGAPPAPVTNDAAVDEAKVCRSPVSGIVVRLIAQPGQNLQVGDPLMVLEAMKMETTVVAPRPGTLTVTAAEGDAVDAGAVLGLVG